MSLRWTAETLFVWILNSDHRTCSLNSVLIIERVTCISVISWSVKVICIWVECKGFLSTEVGI